jgi:acyl carrier protein
VHTNNGPTNNGSPQISPSEVDSIVRQILDVHGRLRVDAGSTDDTDDLFRAGMTSLATVSVMLAIEDECGVEFPDTMLRRSTFESVSSIRSAVVELLTEKAPV